MFEAVQLIGSDEREILLHTQQNRPIRNSQASAELDDRVRQKFSRLLTMHGSWVLRKPPCGVYNCFGHVWASRRTAIYDQSEIDKILEDDGYRPLREDEQPVLGDLILYSVEQSIYHVGLVCELRRITDAAGTAAGQPTPWVLSKWDDTSGEVLHHWADVPFDDAETQFQTDRP